MIKKSYQFVKSAAQRIGKKFHPEQIILFGSYATGQQRKDSDVDLLVIFADGRQNSPRRYGDIYEELGLSQVVPVDLLIRSRKQIQRRLKMGDSFIEEVLTQGRVLYEG